MSPLRVVWVFASVLACGAREPAAPATPHDASVAADDDASSPTPRPPTSVRVHAVFDLPRVADTRALSALSVQGNRLYTLQDHRPRIVHFDADPSWTRFTQSGVIEVQDAPTTKWDGEGLARAYDGSFYAVVDETTPKLAHFGETGQLLEELPLPAHFTLQASGNKGIESLALSPSGHFLFLANENALVGDGAKPSKTRGTLIRILRRDLRTGQDREYAYRTEPLGEGSGGDMGISDLAARDDEQLVMVERGFQADFGNTVRLFTVSLRDGVEITGRDTLDDQAPELEKKLLVDLRDLPAGAVTHPSLQPNPLLDNYEGIAFGPRLPDGSQTLALLSDDNTRDTQVARLLVLAVDDLALASSSRASALTVGPRHGESDDDEGAPTGPGLLLDSGAPLHEVATWMQARAGGGRLEGGDLVVLTAGGGDQAPSLFSSAPFHSATTLQLGNEATAADYAQAAALVDRAEAVYFTGGDQARYVAWKGSLLLDAVRRLHGRGGVVAGSSAGMIVLGEAVNDATRTLSENLTTELCLADPFHTNLHFTQKLFTFEELAGTITDPHFVARDRLGRLSVFMARQAAQRSPAGFRGIGVDDGVALAIDAQGVGRRLGTGGAVHVVTGGQPSQLEAGQPLRYPGLRLLHLTQDEDFVDLRRHCGRGVHGRVDVDASQSPAYPASAYGSGERSHDCP